MSITTVTYPIVAALVKAEDMEGVGPDRRWQQVNSLQDYFLDYYFEPCRYEVNSIPEIESVASWSAEEINEFLRSRGFDIQLKPLDEKTFGVASVFELLVEWLGKGEVTTVRGTDGKDYPGVRIGKNGVKFFSSEWSTHPIAMLGTKSGDRVFLTVFDKEQENSIFLTVRAEARSRVKTPNWDYEGLIFPMVDLDQRVDISWLLGMKTNCDDGEIARITQALQQNILKMNEVGALAKSAVAIAVTRECFITPKPDLIIDKPFLVWIERPGLSKPLFVGYITEENWKNPGLLK